MIESEVSILREVQHENIVALIEDFDTDTELFLVMEYVKVIIKMTLIPNVLFRNNLYVLEKCILVEKLFFLEKNEKA